MRPLDILGGGKALGLAGHLSSGSFRASPCGLSSMVALDFFVTFQVSTIMCSENRKWKLLLFKKSWAWKWALEPSLWLKEPAQI